MQCITAVRRRARRGLSAILALTAVVATTAIATDAHAAPVTITYEGTITVPDGTLSDAASFRVVYTGEANLPFLTDGATAEDSTVATFMSSLGDGLDLSVELSFFDAGGATLETLNVNSPNPSDGVMMTLLNNAANSAGTADLLALSATTPAGNGTTASFGVAAGGMGDDLFDNGLGVNLQSISGTYDELTRGTDFTSGNFNFVRGTDVLAGVVDSITFDLIVVPLPPAMFAGLVGLLAVPAMRRRMAG
ncbi:MAG: hypothetical protein AB8G96_11695 [Phycisphaerales bacterium]